MKLNTNMSIYVYFIVTNSVKTIEKNSSLFLKNKCSPFAFDDFCNRMPNNYIKNLINVMKTDISLKSEKNGMFRIVVSS